MITLSYFEITLSYFDMMGKFPEKLKEILKKASKSKNSQTKRLAISKVSCAFGYTLKWNLKIKAVKIKAGKIPREKDLSVYIEAKRGRSTFKTKIFNKVPQQVWDHFQNKEK